jgi:hypothetical protein
MESMILIEKAPHSIDENARQISTYNEFDELHSYNKMPALEVFSEHTLFWAKEGALHSYDDMPSAIRSLNSLLFNRNFFHLEWSKNGLRHRENDKPAIIGNDGTMAWYIDGKLHRNNDKPALIGERDGTSIKVWAINGFISRAGGKPNLIIGDNLFWIELNMQTRVYSIIKYEKDSKVLHNYIMKNLFKFGIAITLITTLIALIIV